MDKARIRILLVEDNPGDARLVREMLADARHNSQTVGYDIDHVDRLELALTALSKDGYDIVLVDLSLPDSQGLDTVVSVLKVAPETPLIVMSGLDDQVVALKAVQMGTQDYLVKGHVDEFSLPRAIQYAIERKEAEKALNESELRYQILAEISPVGIFRTDAGGQTTYVNPRWCQISGLGFSQALGDGWLSAVYPEDRDALAVGWQQATQDRNSSVQEYRFQRSDGTLAWVLSQAVPERDSRGEIIGYVGTITDISDGKEAEERLNRLYERFTLATQAARLGVWDWDIENDKLVWDDQMYALYGVKRGEFSSAYQAWLNGLHPDDRAKSDEISLQAQRGERPYDSEFRVIWPDGSIHVLKAYGQVIFGEDGAASRMLGINYDITDRKQAEADLQHWTEELAGLHEISQTINAIRDVHQVYGQLSEKLAKFVGAEMCVVALLDPVSDEVQAQNPGYGISNELLAHVHYPRVLGLAVWNLDVHESFLANQPQEIPAEYQGIVQLLDIRSVLVVPLQIAGRFGGIIFTANKPEGFDLEDSHLMRTLANQAGVVIEKASLFDKARRRLDELTLLQAVSLAAIQIGDEDDLIAEFTLIVGQAFYSDHFGVLLVDEDSKTLWVHPSYMGIPEENMDDLIPYGDGITGRVWQTGQPIRVADVTQDSTYRPTTPEIRSELCVPLLVGKQVIGVVNAESSLENAFSEEDERLVTTLAGQLATAISRLRSEVAERLQRQLAEGLHQIALRATERRAILHRLSQEIATSIQEPEQMFQTIGNAAAELMPCDAFILSLLDENPDYLDIVYLVDKGQRYPNCKIPLDGTLSSKVVKENISIRIDDLETVDDLIIVNYSDLENVRSILAAPIRHSGVVLGILSAQSYLPQAYSEDDQSILEMLAAYTATAIKNASLFGETRRRAEEFAALYETTHELTDWQDLPLLLRTIVERARTLLNASDGAMYLFDPERQMLRIEVVTNPSMPRISLKLGEGLAGRVAQDRKAMIVEDYRNWEGRSSQYEGIPVSAVVDVPMLHGGELVGVIVAHEMGDTKKRFTEEDARLLSLFAGQAASVVYNARLLAETQHRLQELEVVNRVSTALRSANTLDEMLPIFLEETLSLFHTNSGNIALFDEQSKVFQTQVTSGWFDNFKTFLPHTDQGISAQVMKGGAIYLSPEFASDPLANPEVHQWIPTGWGGACLPIRSGREIIGLFYIAIELPRRLGDPEIHLLVTLTEMVGNAIHRARLLEKTEKQVARLTALRKVDQAISASLDLRLTLKVLLEQVDSQLKADAACVLLLNPYTLTLEHQSSYGFRTKLIDSQYLRLGEGYASRAILEKKAIHMEALSEEQLDPAFAKLVKAESINSYHVIPLVAKGHVLGVLETYYRAPHQPNQDWFDFFETLAGQAAIAIDNASLFDNLQHSNQNLILAYDRTLEGWARALELRDNETEGHSRRVTEMTLNLARTAGISDENLIHLRRGALLHDIGKMGIPDSILHKPSSLTDEEWVLMRQHPVLAYEMLRSIDYLLPALDIPYCHHEKWDGSGYPRGLKGEEIPLSARIFAVIDVWDALGSDRPYRKAWPREKIVAYIKDESGHHFDPKVVELFFDLLGSNQPVR